MSKRLALVPLFPVLVILQACGGAEPAAPADAEAIEQVYQGKLTGRFAEDVRTGKYGVTEGVICKGGTGGSDLWMAKIKTNAYMERLKRAFGERWEDHWE